MLAFLLKWWEPIAVVILAAALWGLGDYHGHAVATQACATQIQAGANAAQKQRDDDAAAIAAAADQYEKDKQALADQLTIAETELKNEEVKIPAYTTCHVGPDFLRGYKAVAGITTTPAK